MIISLVRTAHTVKGWRNTCVPRAKSNTQLFTSQLLKYVNFTVDS